ncbi:MAG TPA: hypothetical protein VNW50_02895, partial [Streptosporangiaceae bacterium]|nr:hypothetical protein [Streptosporangiaceae bacterium]
MKRTVILLTIAVVGAGLSACSSPPVHAARSAPSARESSVLNLSCAESVGQQGRDHETVVGGVEGLVLPGSAEPA